MQVGRPGPCSCSAMSFCARLFLLGGLCQEGSFLESQAGCWISRTYSQGGLSPSEAFGRWSLWWPLPPSHCEHCVCPPLAARGSVCLSGHMAALGSNWCCVRKRGMGTGLPVQRVPQNAIVILLILFGYNPFEIIAHMKWLFFMWLCIILLVSKLLKCKKP